MLFDDGGNGTFHLNVQGHHVRQATNDDIADCLLARGVGARVVATTHEAFGRNRAGRECCRKVSVAWKDKAELCGRVVVMLRVEVTCNGGIVVPAFGRRSRLPRGIRPLLPFWRGISVILGSHNLLEPDTTHSRYN